MQSGGSRVSEVVRQDERARGSGGEGWGGGQQWAGGGFGGVGGAGVGGARTLLTTGEFIRRVGAVHAPVAFEHERDARSRIASVLSELTRGYGRTHAHTRTPA